MGLALLFFSFHIWSWCSFFNISHVNLPRWYYNNCFFYKDLIPLELIAHINSIGGILIIAIGIKILGYKKINPTNMLPALVVVIIAYSIQVNLV